jgi:hypothetical protein
MLIARHLWPNLNFSDLSFLGIKPEADPRHLVGALGFSYSFCARHESGTCAIFETYGNIKPALPGTKTLRLMRAFFVALIGCLSMAACSLQSPTSEAQSNLLGMTQKQISSCLGPPTQKTKEGVADIWSYPAGQSCLVKIYFTYGRASHVNYVGANGKPVSPGDECPVVGEKCAMR